MSETTTEAPTTTTEAPAEESTSPGTPAKPETDWKAEAKKWESRAKENKSAAEKLAQIEEAQKTEAQKAADRLAVAEKAAAEATREALKFKIAAKFQIGDEDADLFLTGSDEEALTKQAERLTARESERKKHGNVVPREGNNPTSTGEGSDLAFARQLLNPGVT
jgi:hypothetical protein